MRLTFGETYGDRETFGRDFSHRAGDDDGGIDVEGRWRRRTILVFDGRCSVYIEWRLEMLGHPPWGGGALGPLGFAMSIRRC